MAFFSPLESDFMVLISPPLSSSFVNYVVGVGFFLSRHLRGEIKRLMIRFIIVSLSARREFYCHRKWILSGRLDLRHFVIESRLDQPLSACVCVNVCACVRLYIRYIYIYMYVYVCVCVCMYVRVCMYLCFY